MKHTFADRNPDENLNAAEYVLGTLDARARAIFEIKLEQDPALRNEVVYWENQFAEFGLQSPPITPPSRVWREIKMQTGLRPATISKRRRPPRWLKYTSIAASLAAVALLAALVDLPTTDQPIQVVTTSGAPPAHASGALGRLPDSFALPHNAIPWSAPVAQGRSAAAGVSVDPPDFVGNLQDYASNVGWKIAGYNARGALQVTATGTPYTRLWEPSTLELWLMPVNAYEKPISLGLLPVSGERILPIARYVASEFYTNYNKLAVSREPPGGSKIGEPTGPILFMTTLKLAFDR